MTRQSAQPLGDCRKETRATTWRELVRANEEGYMHRHRGRKRKNR